MGRFAFQCKFKSTRWLWRYPTSGHADFLRAPSIVGENSLVDVVGILIKVVRHGIRLLRNWNSPAFVLHTYIICIGPNERKLPKNWVLTDYNNRGLLEHLFKLCQNKTYRIVAVWHIYATYHSLHKTILWNPVWFRRQTFILKLCQFNPKPINHC